MKHKIKTDNITICQTHNFVMDELKFIKKNIKNKLCKEDNQYCKFGNEILKHIDEAIEETRIAKRKGQQMERRLKVYRYSIEKLGFERKKK